MYSSFEIMAEKLHSIVEMDWGMSGDDELELLSPVASRLSQSLANVGNNSSGAGAAASPGSNNSSNPQASEANPNSAPSQ
jgi:hypothetical protein